MKDVKYKSVALAGLNNRKADSTVTRYYDATGEKVTSQTMESRYLDNGLLYKSENTEYYDYPDKKKSFVMTYYNEAEEVSQIINETYNEKGNKTVDTNVLFGEQDTIDANYLANNYAQLNTSDESGIKDLYQKITWGLSYLKQDYNKYDLQEICDCLIKSLNNRLGIENTKPATLSKAALEKLNEGDILGTIKDVLISDEFKEMYYLHVDGVIDDFGQGEDSDCWLLSGLHALSASETGRQLIKDAIHDNGDGSFTVTFQDYNHKGCSVNISKAEIAKARQSKLYSHGDTDVLVMELALIKYRFEGGPIPDNYDISSGHPEYIIGPLVGAGFLQQRENGKIPIEVILDYNYQDFKDGKITFTYSSVVSGTVRNTEGNEVYFRGGHAFAITDINKADKTITLVDPQNSDKPIILPWDQFSILVQKASDNSLDYYYFDKNSIDINDIFKPYLDGAITAEQLCSKFLNLRGAGAFSDEQKQAILAKAEALGGINLSLLKSYLRI